MLVGSKPHPDGGNSEAQWNSKLQKALLLARDLSVRAPIPIHPKMSPSSLLKYWHISWLWDWHRRGCRARIAVRRQCRRCSFMGDRKRFILQRQQEEMRGWDDWKNIFYSHLCHFYQQTLLVLRGDTSQSVSLIKSRITQKVLTAELSDGSTGKRLATGL